MTNLQDVVAPSTGGWRPSAAQQEMLSSGAVIDTDAWMSAPPPSPANLSEYRGAPSGRPSIPSLAGAHPEAVRQPVAAPVSVPAESPVPVETPLDTALEPSPLPLPAYPDDLASDAVLFRLTPSYEPDPGGARPADRLTLVPAVLLPPVGLVVALVRSRLSRSRRGFVPAVLGVAVGVSLGMTGILGAGAAVAAGALADQAEHDRIAASGVEFCSALEADPAPLTAPALGWPTPSATIPDTIAAIRAYADRWDAAAAVAPASVAPATAAVAESARGIADRIETTRVVDAGADRAIFEQHPSTAPLRAWTAEYCG